jgi:hypothetical protein
MAIPVDQITELCRRALVVVEPGVLEQPQQTRISALAVMVEPESPRPLRVQPDGSLPVVVVDRAIQTMD